MSNVLDRLLAQCRFAPFENMAFHDQDTYFLGHDEQTRTINPHFEITVDHLDNLADRLGVQQDDLELGISVRSPRLRRYAALERWHLDDLPATPWSPDSSRLEAFQCSRGMDFVLALRVVAGRIDLEDNGLSKGKILCRRVFSVKENIDTLTFPFQWREFGGDSGYPAEALWVIKWMDPDDDAQFQRPVHDVLTVIVNKKAEVPLRAMGQAQGANDLAWRMLAAEITTQIYADVLSKLDYEPNEDETETLAGQVFARISRASNLPYADIKDLAERDDSLTELRNIVAKIFRVVV